MAHAVAGKDAGAPGALGRSCARHRPGRTLLYRLIETHYPTFEATMASQGKALPGYVEREFEGFLKCGRLEHGFFRVRCEACHDERLVALSCKRRGFCPSCGSRRMAESAALLVDDILPELPIRQWVVTFPHALRFLFAVEPEALSAALSVVFRTLAGHQIRKAGFRPREACTGAVNLIQRVAAVRST